RALSEHKTLSISWSHYQSLTRLGAMFSGKEYRILLPGKIHIK
ncbi:lipid II-degrading bacteriocin, partial [Escherichia coli]|nr:lipid II-degrading bacteriocin [Escherichia coli]